MSPKVASALYSYVEGHYTPWKMLRRRHDDRSRYLIKNISRPTFVEGEQGRFLERQIKFTQPAHRTWLFRG